MTARRLGVFPAYLVGLLPVTALAQDADVRARLQQRHDELLRQRAALSAAQGTELNLQLADWKLAEQSLENTPRAQWLRLEILAALARGDARAAGDYGRELQALDPDSRETLRVAWWAAAAQGDAAFAKQVLDALEKRGIARGSAIERRRQRIESVGRLAPDRSVTAENGTRIDLRARAGVVLVLDFWRLAAAPDREDVAALKALVEEHAGRPHVVFVSVNADAPDELAGAKKFVADHGYDWPQHYEKAPGKAPLADEVFHLGQATLQVVIGPHGYIRWVGQANDATFVYALRAAVQQARGESALVMPRTVTGEQAQAPQLEREAELAREKAEAAAAREKEERESFVPPSELPSNPEARSMLDQARVYLKTGRKRDAKALLEQIVEKYPGTREAAEAKERLQYL